MLSRGPYGDNRLQRIIKYLALSETVGLALAHCATLLIYTCTSLTMQWYIYIYQETNVQYNLWAYKIVIDQTFIMLIIRLLIDFVTCLITRDILLDIYNYSHILPYIFLAYSESDVYSTRYPFFSPSFFPQTFGSGSGAGNTCHFFPTKKKKYMSFFIP